MYLKRKAIFSDTNYDYTAGIILSIPGNRGRGQYNQFMIIGNSWGTSLRCITPDRKRATLRYAQGDRYMSTG
jgi:hypothetical protein